MKNLKVYLVNFSDWHWNRCIPLIPFSERRLLQVSQFEFSNLRFCGKFSWQCHAGKWGRQGKASDQNLLTRMLSVGWNSRTKLSQQWLHFQLHTSKNFSDSWHCRGAELWTRKQWSDLRRIKWVWSENLLLAARTRRGRRGRCSCSRQRQDGQPGEMVRYQLFFGSMLLLILNTKFD